MIVQRAFYILSASGRINAGKIPLKDKVLIVQWCRIRADQQVTEELFESVLSGQIIIVLKHGKQKALAESSRPQKEQKIPSVFKQSNTICPVAIENDSLL